MRYLAAITLLVLAIAMVQPVAAQSFKPDWDAGIAALEKEDYATALRHFRPLAEQGNAAAQLSLGVMHNKGNGVSRDRAEAARWFRRAAKRGNAVTQAVLGATYITGKGVLEDLVMGYVWLNVAASNGQEEAATIRDIFAKKLNKDDLRKARKLSKLCLKKPAKCPEYSDD